MRQVPCEGYNPGENKPGRLDVLVSVRMDRRWLTVALFCHLSHRLPTPSTREEALTVAQGFAHAYGAGWLSDTGLLDAFDCPLWAEPRRAAESAVAAHFPEVTDG